MLKKYSEHRLYVNLKPLFDSVKQPLNRIGNGAVNDSNDVFL